MYVCIYLQKSHLTFSIRRNAIAKNKILCSLVFNLILRQQRKPAADRPYAGSSVRA